MQAINPTGLAATREAATRKLDKLLEEARENGHKRKQEVCTRAILDMMVAKSPEQVTAIYDKAVDDIANLQDLKPQHHAKAA